MKDCFRNLFIITLVIMLSCQFTACSSPALPDEAAVSDEKIVNDRPTVPENVAEGIDYLYDFRFSERYDANITEAFSLSLSDKVSPIRNTLFLFE
ncbi:MAG: hypothetical protein AAGU75_17725, partial [Bacillota bacterium]